MEQALGFVMQGESFVLACRLHKSLDGL